MRPGTNPSAVPYWYILVVTALMTADSTKSLRSDCPSLLQFNLDAMTSLGAHQVTHSSSSCCYCCTDPGRICSRRSITFLKSVLGPGLLTCRKSQSLWLKCQPTPISVRCLSSWRRPMGIKEFLNTKTSKARWYESTMRFAGNASARLQTIGE